MSGLIWAGIGQGIANAGRTAGDYMMRSELDEERQRERAELQRERLAAAERENERNRQLRADLAAQRGSGGSGDGGLSAQDIAQGGSMEGTIAGLTEGSVPNLRKLRAARDSGDFSGYQVDVTKEVDVPNPDNPDYDSKRETRVVKDYPPGFEREISAKLKRLSQIEESYRFGKNYEGLAKGRGEQQGVDFANIAATEPAKAGILAQARRVGEGKELVDVKDNTAFNVSTGANEATAVGQSMIDENKAQTAKYSAEARKVISEASGALQKGATQEKLATMLSSLNKLAEGLDPASAEGKRVQELQMSIVDAMKSNVDTRSGQGGGGKPSEAEAHAEAQRALATKKITLEQVNERLTKAGYKPLQASAAQPAPAPAPGAAPASAPRQEVQPAPDSRVGKARQAQAEAAAKKQAWEDEQKSKASAAFAELDLKDRLATSNLQASPLFAYLTREQKMAIYNAVNSR